MEFGLCSEEIQVPLALPLTPMCDVFISLQRHTEMSLCFSFLANPVLHQYHCKTISPEPGLPHPERFPLSCCTLLDVWCFLCCSFKKLSQEYTCHFEHISAASHLTIISSSSLASGMTTSGIFEFLPILSLWASCTGMSYISQNIKLKDSCIMILCFDLGWEFKYLQASTL